MNIKQLSAAGYAKAADGTKPSASKSGAEMAVSSEAKSLHVALSGASHALHDASKDIDFGRVNAIRQALANGTLTINPEKIAEGLIDSAKSALTPSNSSKESA